MAQTANHPLLYHSDSTGATVKFKFHRVTNAAGTVVTAQEDGNNLGRYYVTLANLNTALDTAGITDEDLDVTVLENDILVRSFLFRWNGNSPIGVDLGSVEGNRLSFGKTWFNLLTDIWSGVKSETTGGTADTKTHENPDGTDRFQVVTDSVGRRTITDL